MRGFRGRRVLLAAGILLWSLISTRSDWLPLGFGVAAYSSGLSIHAAPITTTALSSAPAELSGIARELKDGRR